MLNFRIIPVLLLQNAGIVKTVKFRNPVYLGDPINAIHIFNEKEVDELVFLDINASKEKRGPDFTLLENIASECFMPLAYGGGIRSFDEVKRILQIGIEKVIFNTAVFINLDLISETAKITGSQSVVVSVDIKKNKFGRRKVYVHSRNSLNDVPIPEFVRMIENAGAGEIFLNSVDNDGMMQSYDLDLIRQVAIEIRIPVIACGGAGNYNHFKQAIESGASAVAAGSMFVFHGPHKAVLINYPTSDQLTEIYSNGQ